MSFVASRWFNPTPRGRMVLVSTAVLLAPGCALGPDLDTTAATAREAVLAVRPQADLNGVRARLLTASVDLKSLVKDDRSGLWLPELGRIVDENAPALVQLSLLDSNDVDEIRREFVDLYMADHSGVAVGSKGLILIVPDQARSIETCAHELAHIATARKGYLLPCSRRYFPRTEGVPDPAWVDLDAMLASKLLSEADAQLTARAAVAFREGGAEALRRLWRAPVDVDPPQGKGPLKVKHPDGTVIELGPGEPFYDTRQTALRALNHLAYGGSVALLLARHKDGEGLEDTLRSIAAKLI